MEVHGEKGTFSPSSLFLAAAAAAATLSARVGERERADPRELGRDLGHKYSKRIGKVPYLR